MTWEEIIIQIRKQPEYSELVEKAYFDEDLALNVQRFKASEEYSETINLIRKYSNGGKNILDIGSGNGIAAVAFALDGYHVTAVEPDSSNTVGGGAIKILKEQFNLVHLNVFEAWGESLPFQDQSFDIVYIRQAMHHAQDLNKFLTEGARVLRRGGMLMTVRDHVVFNDKDKQWFLESHPLHKFYGGENAFLPEEYERGMKSAGLQILLKLKHFDSPMNYFPMTKEEVNGYHIKSKREVVELLSKRMPELLASFPPVIWLYKLWTGKNIGHAPDEREIAGRMYSYITRKSS